MDNKEIAVSLVALTEVLKKSELFLEETYISLQGVTRAVDNAELMGWKDQSYTAFKDSFEDIKYGIKGALREVEDTLIPTLKKHIDFIENFK